MTAEPGNGETADGDVVTPYVPEIVRIVLDGDIVSLRSAIDEGKPLNDTFNGATQSAADLAVLLAVMSSFRNRPLPSDLIVFGEVGLSGELRPVPNGQERLREAAKLGFKQALIPEANAPRHAIDGLQVQAVSRYGDVLDWFS